MFGSKPTCQQRPFAAPIALALLATAFSFPARAQRAPDACRAPARSPLSMARKLTVRDVPDFGEATPMLYRGALPSKEGFRSLAKIGINIVVDLRGSRESERRLVNSLGMQNVARPWQRYHPRDKPSQGFSC
jgi:hypothetical protein